MIDSVDFDFTVKFEKIFYIFCWDYIFMFSGGTIYLKKKKNNKLQQNANTDHVF